jgi:hypothetical protein
MRMGVWVYENGGLVDENGGLGIWEWGFGYMGGDILLGASSNWTAEEFISVLHLETMDLPFPQYLISDPWQNGHLDISLFKLAKHSTEAD